MYFSGVVVAFFFAFLVFMYQGAIRRRNGADETFFKTLAGSLLGSTLGSIFSWFLVLILIGMILSKGVWGINGEE
jgi:SNF family Na+-dependent transporter